MARRERGSGLPGGLYFDGTYYRMKMANGRFCGLGRNKQRALRKFRQTKRLESVGELSDSVVTHRMTMNTVAKHWRQSQQLDGRRDVDRDYARFERHAARFIGKRRIDEIDARELVRMIRDLKREAKDDGSPRHADSSIANMLGVCSSMFDFAIFEGAIDVNPVKHIPNRKRPKKQGKKGTPYRTHEAVALMTDPHVPEDRRVLYTLQALTGMRIGEACGRRWRDYDRNTPELGWLHIWSQYDDQPLKTGRATHEKERFTPVHPVLAKAIAEWRLNGFTRIYGRAPADDDFIVPDPATMGARSPNKSGKDHRKDATTLGVYTPSRLTHGLRRWFISVCRNAAARTEVIELITHNTKGEVIDAYTSWEWSTLCNEIAKLEVDLEPSNVVTFAISKTSKNEKHG